MFLEAAYGKLLLRFGLGEFKVSEAREVLGDKSIHLALHRLQRAGYLVRVSRGSSGRFIQFSWPWSGRAIAGGRS